MTMSPELFAQWGNIKEDNFFETSKATIKHLVHLISAKAITDLVTQYSTATFHLFQAQMSGHPIFVRVDATKQIWVGDDESNLEFWGEL